MQKAFRGSIFHCLSDPGPHADESAVEHIEDGLLVIEDGKVVATGEASELLPTLADDAAVEDHSGKLIEHGLWRAEGRPPIVRVGQRHRHVQFHRGGNFRDRRMSCFA